MMHIFPGLNYFPKEREGKPFRPVQEFWKKGEINLLKEEDPVPQHPIPA